MAMSASKKKKKKIKSILKAAEIYSVPESTLRYRLKGNKSRSETRANGHRLTASEAETLTKHVLEAGKQGFPVRPEFLRGMARILLRGCLQDSTTEFRVNWAYKLIKRHEDCLLYTSDAADERSGV